MYRKGVDECWDYIKKKLGVSTESERFSVCVICVTNNVESIYSPPPPTLETRRQKLTKHRPQDTHSQIAQTPETFSARHLERLEAAG